MKTFNDHYLMFILQDEIGKVDAAAARKFAFPEHQSINPLGNESGEKSFAITVLQLLLTFEAEK